MAYPNFYQPYPQQQPNLFQNGAGQQTNGFISVRNELEARNYPIAHGNSITFKDETAPYVYVKTMGFSQLDRPIFEKFKLVKEEVTEPQIQAETNSVDKNIIDNIQEQIKALWGEINALKEAPKKTTKKKEVADNE